MNKRILLALIAVLLLALVAGCPRGEEETPPDDMTPSGETEETSDDSMNAEDNPCADAEEDGSQSEAEGENPCADAEGENPCGDAAADDMGENPCNPCADAGEETEMTEDANVVEVVLESSDGEVVIAVHPDWAPLGAERFLELVKIGFYDGAPIFRNIDGFMAQFGIAADPSLTEEWQQNRIMDDPVKQSNTRGMVTFAMAGPNTRTFQVFINKEDKNAGLDRQGFAPFGEVVSGMDVVDGWHITGDGTVNQGQLSSLGIKYFNQIMPDGDVIKRAYIRE